MKLTFSASLPMPGGFILEAETPEEIGLLNLFAQWGYIRPGSKLTIGSHGGNIREGVFSLNICWQMPYDYGKQQTKDAEEEDT